MNEVFRYSLWAVFALLMVLSFKIIYKKKEIDLGVTLTLAGLVLACLALFPSSTGNDISENEHANRETAHNDSLSKVSSTKMGDTVQRLIAPDTANPSRDARLPEKRDSEIASTFNEQRSKTRTDKAKNAEEVQKNQVKSDSLTLHFNRPEFETRYGCSGFEGFIYQDSLQMAVVRLRSMGAKGRMVGIYDTLLRRALTFSLFRTEDGSLKLERTTFFETDQNFELGVLVNRWLKIEDVFFDILFLDVQGNTYRQKIRPKVGKSCISHRISKPILFKSISQ